MVNNPIGNAEFRKLMTKGITAELSVVHSLNTCEFDVREIGIYSEMIDATDDVPLDYHCDILMQAADRHDGWSPTCNDAMYDIEVKSAENGGKWLGADGKKTFFAEIIQTGTMGYPEYLVTPPDFMVYVDIKDNTHYWYDGHQFAQKVKNCYYLRFPIARGTAEGIKFTCDNPEFGFLFKHDASEFHTFKQIIENNVDHIKGRLNRKKIAQVHKRCAGLPTLP